MLGFLNDKSNTWENKYILEGKRGGDERPAPLTAQTLGPVSAPSDSYTGPWQNTGFLFLFSKNQQMGFVPNIVVTCSFKKHSNLTIFKRRSSSVSTPTAPGSPTGSATPTEHDPPPWPVPFFPGCDSPPPPPPPHYSKHCNDFLSPLQLLFFFFCKYVRGQIPRSGAVKSHDTCF